MIDGKHLAFLAFRLHIHKKNQDKQNGLPNGLVLQSSLLDHSFGVSMRSIRLLAICS